MAGALYCTKADIYEHIPSGSLVNQGRPAIASATSDAITIDSHGLDDGDIVRVRAEVGGNLPGGLAPATNYFIVSAGESTFQLSATEGGSAIDITANGDEFLVIVPINEQAAIKWASRIFEDMCPAHAMPLEAPYPEVVVLTVGELAAGKLARKCGATSASLSKIYDDASARIARWAKGIPLRGADAPGTHTNLATSATVPFDDSRGWNRFGGL